MRRQILAFVSALIVWVLVASLLNRLLRVGLSGYADAEPAMAFTMAMKWARLTLAGIASLSGGYVLARVAPDAKWLPVILGGLLLVGFVPVHYQLWNQFPVWYHLVFLLSIIPFFMLGARLGIPKQKVAVE